MSGGVSNGPVTCRGGFTLGLRSGLALRSGLVGTRVRAFTLLEVLLAIVLIVIIVTAAGTLLVSVAEARDQLERYTLRQTATDALLTQVETDLVGAVAGNGSGGAGVEGTAHELKVLTRGRWLGAEGPSASDLCRCEVSFSGDRVRLTRRVMGLGTLTALGDGVSGEVQGVRRAEFWYYDGRAWRREFNSAKDGGLPAAVEVRLWYGASGEAAEGEEGVSRGVDGDAPIDTPPDRRIVIAIPDGGVSRASGGGGP